MPTSPAGSRSCAGRNRRCGDRKRSAAWSRSTAIARAGGTAGRRRGRQSSTAAAARPDHVGNEEARLSLGAAPDQRSDGIDAFLGGGERDGYRNLSLRGAGRLVCSPAAVGRRFGFAHPRPTASSTASIPLTFSRADTLDETKNRLGAGPRLVHSTRTSAGTRRLAVVSLLGSQQPQLAGRQSRSTETERQALDGERPVVAAFRHRGDRASIDWRPGERVGELSRRGRSVSAASPTRIASRRHESLTGEWQAKSDDWLVTDARRAPRQLQPLQGRHHLARLGTGRSRHAASLVAGSWGEGIAQPSFFDLFGFFPGGFVGNPDLRPERSRGVRAVAPATIMDRSGPRSPTSASDSRTRSSTIRRPSPARSMPTAPASARASRPSCDWSPANG